MTQTVYVEAIDLFGNRYTMGGEIFILKTERHCELSTVSRLCVESEDSGTISETPTFTEMNYIDYVNDEDYDNSNYGLYWA